MRDLKRELARLPSGVPLLRGKGDRSEEPLVCAFSLLCDLQPGKSFGRNYTRISPIGRTGDFFISSRRAIRLGQNISPLRQVAGLISFGYGLSGEIEFHNQTLLRFDARRSPSPGGMTGFLERD